MEIVVSASRALNGSSSRSSDGRPDQRAGQRHPLRLAAGQRQRPGRRPLGEPDLRERLGRHPGRVGGAQPERDVVEHPLPRHQARLLEGDRDRLGHGHRPGHVPVEPGERPEQGGLARPAPPDHRDELARLDVQVEPVEHHPVTETLASDPARRPRPDRSRPPWPGGGRPGPCSLRELPSPRTALAAPPCALPPSASSPRIAYTIRQTTMMLFSRNCSAVVIMKPIPALALICSPTTARAASRSRSAGAR